MVAILRHGKANQASPTGHDADRPLLARGVRQADWMADALEAAGFSGCVVVCSPAVRTLQTADRVASMISAEVREDARLFLGASVGSVLELLAEHAESDRLVIVGHNPTISMAASVLTRGVGPCTISLRTGAAAVCEHDGKLEPGSARLRGIWRLDD